MDAAHRSPIFALSEEYIAESAALSPIGATFLGLPGFEEELDDFSLAGWNKKTLNIRATLLKLSVLPITDHVDAVAKAVLKERLESELALLDSYERQLSAAVISSPVIYIRQVFEMMSTETAEDIDLIATRMYRVDQSHLSWVSTLGDLAAKGRTVARRQVEGIAKQLDSIIMINANRYKKKREAI